MGPWRIKSFHDGLGRVGRAIAEGPGTAIDIASGGVGQGNRQWCYPQLGLTLKSVIGAMTVEWRDLVVVSMLTLSRTEVFRVLLL